MSPFFPSCPIHRFFWGQPRPHIHTTLLPFFLCHFQPMVIPACSWSNDPSRDQPGLLESFSYSCELLIAVKPKGNKRRLQPHSHQLHWKTLWWHFHENRKFVLSAHKAACPPSGLKGMLNNFCLKAECMALDLCYHLLKTVMLEAHFPLSPRFRIEALFLIHRKKKLMTPMTSCITFRLSFLKAAAIQEQLSTAKV